MKTRNTTTKLIALIAVAIATPQTSYTQGTRAKDVTVVNTPNVNVVNTPTVNFAARANVGINPSSNTVHVASSSREPVLTTQVLLVQDVFQKELEIPLVPGAVQGSSSFTVPAGKLLVIEDLSGFATMGDFHQSPQALFRTTANNNFAQHFLIAQPFGAGFQIFVFGKPTIYADPGSTVDLIFVRSSVVLSTVGTAKLNVTISGHYITQ